MAMFRRLAAEDRPPVRFTFNGQACEARDGDTVLTAVLVNGAALGRSESDGTPRAGFCLMGACQDCWVRDEAGRRLRACSTFIRADMALYSLDTAS